MSLPLSHHWPVRCARCGNRAEITASVADLASKALRCGACGHRQQTSRRPSSIIPCNERLASPCTPGPISITRIIDDARFTG